MNTSRGRCVVLHLFVTLSVLIGCVVWTVPALAETLGVSGMDSLYSSESQDGSVDLLLVTGAEGQTVYINMSQGKEPIASHLAFTLDGQNAQTDANGDMVGIASVQFNGTSFSAEDEYSIEVFADRAQTELLYTGTARTLFARFDGRDVTPLALRTLAKKEERPFDVPQTLEHNGMIYDLAIAKPSEVDGRTVYDYEASPDAPDTTTAHIYYYDIADPTGDPIRTTKIDLARGESQDVSIESVIAAQESEDVYRTLQLSNTVTLSYPGATSVAIMCKKLDSSWNKVGSFYKATIAYVDGNGKSLGVADTVLVNKKYTYTAPSNLYVDDEGTVRAYKLHDSSAATLTLQPGDAEGSKTYQIVYDLMEDDEERTWTIVLHDGSVAPADPKRELGRITLRGKPGETVTFDATKDARKYVDPSAYEPIAACAKTYEHTFGVASMEVEQTIYYVPTGYVAPQAYDVTVKYVNIANNKVITTQTYTASPSMRSDLEIQSPESFLHGGVEWVRLNGQEKAIRHGFYSAARAYTVYYRDVNDDLHRQTVIRNVRVEYKDVEGNTITRPTTITNNGTTATYNGVTNEGTSNEDVEVEGAPNAGETTAAPAEAQADAISTGLQTGADLRSIDAEDGATLVSEDGTDLATTRIEDDETPLAGPGEAQAAASAATAPTGAVVAGVAGVGALALLLVFFWRRKKNADDSSNNDVTA